MKHLFLASAALCLSSAASAATDRLLDPMFADHALVQRDRPIAVWGRAAAGENVTVSLGNSRATAKAGTD